MKIFIILNNMKIIVGCWQSEIQAKKVLNQLREIAKLHFDAVFTAKASSEAHIKLWKMSNPEPNKIKNNYYDEFLKIKKGYSVKEEVNRYFEDTITNPYYEDPYGPTIMDKWNDELEIEAQRHYDKIYKSLFIINDEQKLIYNTYGIQEGCKMEVHKFVSNFE